MKFKLTFLSIFFTSLAAFAQDTDIESEEISINQYIEGTLLKPKDVEKPPLVILLQGSGPTDRDGNQAFMKNDSFKKLANELAEKGIATFRYDKRILQMGKLGIKETDMKFDDFVTDANSAIEHFENSGNFGKIVVLGHSQGALVGMLAAKGKADALVSIAGPAQPIDTIITEQVAQQLPELKSDVQQTFREIREKGSTTNYNTLLESIFRPSVQPFILSWMKYNPQEEIQKLEIPVLLINGTKDLQVSQTEAEKLQKNYPEAELVVLENMNHVFREIDGSDLENSKSYNEPARPLHPELVPEIVAFIEQL